MNARVPMILRATLLVAVLARVASAHLTCVTFVHLVPGVSATLTCVNNGCVIDCSQITETLPGFGSGLTCSCDGVHPPRCCHLIAYDQGDGNPDVWTSGSCGVDGCPSGSLCIAEGLIYEDGSSEWSPKCLGP